MSRAPLQPLNNVQPKLPMPLIIAPGWTPPKGYKSASKEGLSGAALTNQIVFEQRQQEQEEQEKSENEFVTIARPYWDYRSEHPVDMFDDAPEKEKARLRKLYDTEAKKYDRKDPAKHPKWKWVASRRCLQMLESVEEEFAKRNPDEYEL